MPTAIEESDHGHHRNLTQKVARVLDDIRSSNATHIRKLKDLSVLRDSSPVQFFEAFSNALIPLFNFQRRTASAERIVKFVSLFAFTPDAKNSSSSDGFLENFLRFLLLAAEAANKTARYRACQIISEIIMRLPDDAEVSSELWDEVIECMKSRVGDKFPVVRSFAIRALLRFANESENRDIIDLFLQALPLEQNADVRKTIVLSLPPSNETLSTIIDSTLDVSESVRKAAFCVIASKFPLQTLSIKIRTTILQRGLADRSKAVAKECLKLMKDEWLLQCCNRDPIELLKFLDVETYESVGESVMATLLKEGWVSLKDGQTIRQFLASTSDATEAGDCNHGIQLMEAEVALYWRMVCKHLQMEASRGLADRSKAVAKECLKLMKDEWLLQCCNRDPIELLKFLDVETYESVGESVMATLLKEGWVSLKDGQTIRQFLASTSDATEGDCNRGIQLMEAEVALYWRMVCKHLQMEASKCISKAFMPVMRSLWPGINGNATGSTIMVSNMRKRAVQASRFMLQMMKVPLYAKETAPDESDGESLDNQADPSLDFESGEEGLAIRIAVEVASFHAKKTAAGKSYLSAVCRILVLLQFQPSEQEAIKLVRQLLNRVSESVAAEKDLLKELRQMAERLKLIDGHPDQKLSSDQANQILGRLELEVNLEEDDTMEVPATPAVQSTRPGRARRRVRVEEESSSADELTPTSVVPTNPAVMSTRSQRASKTAALTKMTAKQTVKIDENDENDDDDSGSEVTSEDDSGSEVTSEDDSDAFD
ncbi:uncharacterized protein LOC111397973 [Olea europaea var. sylvestris]|uniref:uncharacterized protein LOC111397973 n=1 Tax=Olea europaea var. sylvestris TaxID=158386 RepID=UPI000C1CD9A9|nr:uncharacterized protein LOC111397973 [Olea europaea var. sylvestris]